MRAGFVVAFADHITPGLEDADVVFPAASYAEKEGTMTHPDGPSPAPAAGGRPPRRGPPAGARPGGAVLAARRIGRRRHDATGHRTGRRRGALLRGMTLEEIGGRGVRWQEREAASELHRARPPRWTARDAAGLPEGTKLGTVRTLWAGRKTARALAPVPRAEPAGGALRRGRTAARHPARRRGGDSHERNQRARRARLRQAVQPGTLFLLEGELDHGAVVEVRKA